MHAHQRSDNVDQPLSVDHFVGGIIILLTGLASSLAIFVIERWHLHFAGMAISMVEACLQREMVLQGRNKARGPVSNPSTPMMVPAPERQIKPELHV